MHGLSKARGRYTSFPLKEPCKIGLIFKAHGNRHINYGDRCPGQQFLCSHNPFGVNPFPHATAGVLFNLTAQVVFTYSCSLCIGRDCPNRLVWVEHRLQETVYHIGNSQRLSGFDARQEKVQSLLNKHLVTLVKRLLDHIEKLGHKDPLVKPESLMDRNGKIAQRFGIGNER